ncbi:DNA-binding transcriptional regulator, GntR family [Nonomuraea maritima]|uniref:DNA-binding transcriptional regulator, GntR family n=1 Tax=Nonomuraea maritima TaxID=683260 RepID=A0A1G8WEF2_9ACTN|nr:DNA-binding transcriptional regulator, GntR family [Nonomuraea maritima]
MDSQGSFPLGPSSLTEALYESVRKRIVNGEIAPGEKLTEVRIASEYNVARPTAKACLERLTALGLLRRSVHKTAVVPKLDEDEIRDLYFSRETVERAAVAALARRGVVPPAAVRAQAAMKAAATDMAFENQVEADIAFHAALVTGVGSRRLARMHEVILGEIHLTMGQFQAHRTTHPMNVAREHDDILKAIEDADPEAAQQCLTHHLDQAQDRLIGQLRREGGAVAEPSREAPA